MATAPTVPARTPEQIQFQLGAARWLGLDPAKVGQIDTATQDDGLTRVRWSSGEPQMGSRPRVLVSYDGDERLSYQLTLVPFDAAEMYAATRS